MANTPIALVIAGSGDTSPDEIADLLNDAYPDDRYDVDLFVPVDKDLFTKTVENVIDWVGDPKYVYPVRTKGAALSRKSSKFENAVEVEKFSDVFDPAEFKDWDEVHFLIALPDPEDEDAYETYAEMVEAAIEHGITVKNLCMGLDDVVLEEEEPEAEPEPEPEKPARRRRGRSEEEPDEPEEKPKRNRAKKTEPEKDLQQEVAEARAEVEKEPVNAPIPQWLVTQNALHTAVSEIIEVLENLRDALAPSPAPEVPEARPDAAEPEETPRRGRGRPRTHFEVRQIWDEDEEEWVPRPKGRIRKGTKIRTVHAESGEVLEEGTA